jgi:cytochrome c-type biogenesis protein CcmH/NrfG
MNDLRKAAEMALEALETLWGILDDIDTASDMAKENDAWYRKRVEALQKKRWDTMITTDGHKLKGGPVEALRQALAQEEQPWVKSYCGGKPNYTTPEKNT